MKPMDFVPWQGANRRDSPCHREDLQCSHSAKDAVSVPLICGTAHQTVANDLSIVYSYFRPCSINSDVPINAFRPSKSSMRSLNGAVVWWACRLA